MIIIINKNNKSRMCSGVVMTWDVFFGSGFTTNN
jgi:hypothetical protein